MKNSKKTGNVLLVVLILGTALAITAASMFSLVTFSLKQTDRSYHYNTATNLAEAGVEEALWALNNHDWTKRGWVAVDASTYLYKGSFASSDLISSNSIPGYFNVIVESATTTPVITAEAVVKPITGNIIRKQIRVNAKNTNLFMPPFTAIASMKLNGGIIDSYKLSEGNYDTAPRGYNNVVASPSTEVNSINDKAEIYGFMTVGFDSTHNSTFPQTLKGDLIGPYSQENGAGVVSNGNYIVDTNRIAYDFTQSFPAPPAPQGTFLSSIPSADSRGMVILGDPTGATVMKYQVADYSASNVLIVGPVELKVLGNLSLSGNSSLTVLNGSFTVPGSPATKRGNTITPETPAKSYTSTSAAVTVYAYGSVSISGNASVNGSLANGDKIPGYAVGTDPRSLKLYGMSTTSQDFSISGNGVLAAGIYAPNANVKFNGGGANGGFAGAIVSKTITIDGGKYTIRFPEEMANQSIGSTYQLSKWTELENRSNWHTF